MGRVGRGLAGRVGRGLGTGREGVGRVGWGKEVTACVYVGDVRAGVTLPSKSDEIGRYFFLFHFFSLSLFLSRHPLQTYMQ